MRTLIIALTIFTLSLASSPSVHSAPVHSFNKDVAAAYGFYREAYFLLGAGNAQVASLELEEMADQWAAVIERFGPTPPDVYSIDPAWMKTLEAVDKSIARGLRAAVDGDAKAAKKAIRPIRKILSDLRRRNGVFVFSDCIDQANAAFADLYKFRYAPPDFNAVEQVDQLRQATAVTAFWYEQCRTNASRARAQDPEFMRLMDDSLYSLSRIWVAIADKAESNLISILRGLRSSDRMLFLRFG
jgi:hypothetical protein